VAARHQATGRESPIPLLGAGAFALVWIAARAWTQSITIDEADTYLAFARPDWPAHWVQHANNHVLNSALMRLATMIFGASVWTIRLPAMAGAALYIACIHYLARFLFERTFPALCLFTCLVFNPFVMDYLVAARGYSLALGLMALAWAVAAHLMTLAPAERANRLAARGALISVSLALSFCANFSFGIADGVSVATLACWALRGQIAGRVKALAAFVAPGLAAAAVLAGPVVWAWPRDQMEFGASSLSGTLISVLKDSLYEPNAYLLHPVWREWLARHSRYLFPALGAALLLRVAALLRGGAEGSEASRRGRQLAFLCAATLTLTLAGLEILHLAVDMRLPVDRRALYVAPLCLLMAGGVAAIPIATRLGRASGAAMTGALALVALYSLTCLRLTYFKEWLWDADAKVAYGAVAYYNSAYGVTEISCDWRYYAALRAYQALSGRENLKAIHERFPGSAGESESFPLYVLNAASDGAFPDREKLKVVYRSAWTGTIVAIRPEVEAAGPCRQPGAGSLNSAPRPGG